MALPHSGSTFMVVDVGFDATPNLKALAEDLPASVWRPLPRSPAYTVQTQPQQRPTNIKESGNHPSPWPAGNRHPKGVALVDVDDQSDRLLGKEPAHSPAMRRCRPFTNAGGMSLVFSIVEWAVALGHRRKGRVSTRRSNPRAQRFLRTGVSRKVPVFTGINETDRELSSDKVKAARIKLGRYLGAD
jgi:hypothetical protein